jgi:Fur family peroxide stress response transcriptional regulator
MIETISNTSGLKERIAANGLKPTYQRIVILDYLNKHKTEHLTAEKIYEGLIKRMPMLSLTTVYNTLSSFLKAGLVSAITITGTEVRYDPVTMPHHHFLCKACGKIIDVDVSCPIANRKTIRGCRIEEVHGYFKGLCKDCLSKRRKQ